MSGILVVGRNGQLARSLRERAALQNIDLTFIGRPNVDLADPDSLRRAVAQSAVRVIVNAAAYTAVDQAEDEPEAALAVNADGPRVLAEAARDAGARLIHISTDYVFDGSGEQPWREDDPTEPRTVYGRTKLEGERAVRAALPGHVILRTAWVYSPFESNFVKTMLRLADSGSEIRVVGDQFGNPTSALDIADGVLRIIQTWRRDPTCGLGATYHLSAPDCTSWANFAREIFAVSRDQSGPFATVVAIPSAEWPAKAPRPMNGRLNSELFDRTFGYAVPPWRESLAPVVSRLLASTRVSDNVPHVCESGAVHQNGANP